MDQDAQKKEQPITSLSALAPMAGGRSLQSLGRKWLRWGLWTALGLVIGAGAMFAMQKIQESYIEEISVQTPQNSQIPGISASSHARAEIAAPNILLNNTDHVPVDLYAYRGKPVVLFFFAGWNSASLDQLGILEGSWKKLEEMGVASIAVGSLEPEESLGLLRARGAYTVPMLADSEGVAGEAYAIGSLPAFFFIDEEGIIKDRYAGILKQAELSLKALRLIKH